MAEDSKDKLLRLLEQAGIPFAAIIYGIATASQLRDALNKLGWRISSVLVLLASVIWSVFVWTAKRPNLLEPAHLQNRFGMLARFASVLAVVVACVPCWYVVAHSEPMVPRLSIKVINRRGAPVELSSYGEAYFSVPSGPMMDTDIGSTRLEVMPADRRRDLVVPPQSFRWVSAEFLNEAQAESMLRQGDIDLAISLETHDQGMLYTAGIPFRRKEIAAKYVELVIDGQQKAPEK
jgi:hypothetical protein